MIDLHSHLLPNVDDGARSLAEAIELARAAQADGVTAIAATPHVRDDFRTSPATIEHGVATLRAELAAAGVAIDVLQGAEVDIDMLWEIDVADLRRLTLAGGSYLLLETPYRGWPRASRARWRICGAAGSRRCSRIPNGTARRRTGPRAWRRSSRPAHSCRSRRDR